MRCSWSVGSGSQGYVVERVVVVAHFRKRPSETSWEAQARRPHAVKEHLRLIRLQHRIVATYILISEKTKAACYKYLATPCVHKDLLV